MWRWACRSTCREVWGQHCGWLSPSTIIWVLESELWSPGLCCKHLFLLKHLAEPSHSCLYLASSSLVWALLIFAIPSVSAEMSHPWRPFLSHPCPSDLISKLLSCFLVCLFMHCQSPHRKIRLMWPQTELLCSPGPTPWQMIGEYLKGWLMNYQMTGPLCHQETLSFLLPHEVMMLTPDLEVRDPGAGEMALSLKNLSHKHHNLSSIGRTYIKRPCIVVGEAELPEAHWPPTLYKPGASGQWDALL